MARENVLSRLLQERYVHCSLGWKMIVPPEDSSYASWRRWPECPECGGRHAREMVGIILDAKAAQSLGLERYKTVGWGFKLPACLEEEALRGFRSAEWRIAWRREEEFPKDMLRGDKL